MTKETKETREFSLSGAPVYRYGESKDLEASGGECRLEQIQNHVERHLGPIETVFHELVSDAVHIDVLFVQPTVDWPYVTLVTSGMSDKPMAVPEGVDAPRHMELFANLPADWRLGDEAFRDEAWYWPVRTLKFLARFPHKFDTWLGFGHTLPNGDPPEPYVRGTKLCCALILPSLNVPREFWTLRADDGVEIHFNALYPIYVEEMHVKMRDGIDGLLERFDAAGVDEVIKPRRPNSCI